MQAPRREKPHRVSAWHQPHAARRREEPIFCHPPPRPPALPHARQPRGVRVGTASATGAGPGRACHGPAYASASHRLRPHAPTRAWIRVRAYGSRAQPSPLRRVRPVGSLPFSARSGPRHVRPGGPAPSAPASPTLLSHARSHVPVPESQPVAGGRCRAIAVESHRLAIQLLESYSHLLEPKV